MAKILIKDGLLVDTEWQRHQDILIEGSKIVRIAPDIDAEKIKGPVTVISADGLCVLPGLIDAHTHYHLVSRGTVTADSFAEASKLAAFGGVTTVVDFADDNKKSLSQSLDARKKEMKEMAIDYALHMGVYSYRDDIKKELEDVKKKGIGTIKLYTTYKDVGYLIEKKEDLKKVLSACKELGIMVSVHCEDDKIIEKINKNWKGEHRPIDHAELRPSIAEAEAIKKMGELSKELGFHLYVVHLSSKEGLEEVRKLRNKGIRLSVETTPHYLFLNKEKLKGPDAPLYVMTPPLREREDNIALQEALLEGEIQVVATDHCAFTREQKLESNDCRTIYPGIPGTEEMISLLNTFRISSGRLSMQQIVNLLSTGPAKEFGLYPKKGTLKVGSDADIVLFHPELPWQINKDTIHSASGYSVYDGMDVNGKVLMTILRGRIIMGDGIYLGINGDGSYVKAVR